MGRRRLWIIVGTALLFAAISILILGLLAPREPFRFLDGHKPVPSPVREGEAIYSWRFGSDPVLERIRAELLDAGFRDVDSSGPGAFFLRGSGAARDGDWVDVELNARLERDHFYSAPGWVTVTVTLRQAHSLWDRIKAVFGL